MLSLIIIEHAKGLMCIKSPVPFRMGLICSGNTYYVTNIYIVNIIRLSDTKDR